jgi:citrate synthase
VRIIFWRQEPLSPDEERLLLTVEQAHRKSALRDCASSVAVRSAAGGSGSFEAALAAGLLNLGGKHAPIREIFQFLEKEKSDQQHDIISGRKIPGWGNSFFKGTPDPDWYAVRPAFLPFQGVLDRIDFITTVLHSVGKKLYPNAGCYTAAAARIVGLPAETASYLLISARLPIWTYLAQKEL